jgi:glycosyltransferase involved in cell wall biosynthesis
VVEDPSDVNEAVRRIAQLLDDDELRAAMGRASRARAIAEFSYEMLATRLGDALGVRE